MESLAEKSKVPAWLTPYADIRTDSYVVLAALLGQSPSEEVIAVTRELEWNETIPQEIIDALRSLREAAHEASREEIREEFNRLFVGLGCGEIVPYASWYRDKKIQSKTLARLRQDLYDLGLVRQAENHESEDHAGALCEIMALISHDKNGAPYAVQANFFRRHIQPWMLTFFRDLQKAKSASFYRAVAVFGSSFLTTEKEYLKHGTEVSSKKETGGVRNENGIYQ